MYVKKNNTSLIINIDIKKQGDKYVVFFAMTIKGK